MGHLLRLAGAGIALIAIAALTSVGLFAIVAGGLPFSSPATRTSPGGVPFLVTIQGAQGTPTPAALPGSTPMPGTVFPPMPPAPAGLPPAATGPGASSSGPGTMASGSSQGAPSSGSANGASASGPANGGSSLSSANAEARAASTPEALSDSSSAATSVSDAGPKPGATPSTASGLTSDGPATRSLGAATGHAAPGGSRPSLGEPDAQAVHEGVTLEVSQIDRGWQAVGPDGAVQQTRDGFELVTLQVRLANGAGELRYVADSDIVLVGEDGSRFAARHAAPLRDPHLLTVPLPPGDVIRGWLSYEVPTGLAAPRLQWSPTRPDRARAEATYLLTLHR